MKLSEDNVRKALAQCIDPHLQRDLVSAGLVKSIEIDNQCVEIKLGYHFYPGQALLDKAQTEWSKRVADACSANKVTIVINVLVSRHKVQPQVDPVPQIKNVIAVASAKGGVGKSTTAVNLALALAADGAEVGLLDADIYGPSVPMMLGLQGQKPDSEDGKTIIPLEAYGIKAMSMGMLVGDEQAMIWRGPMVTQALQQLFSSAQWGELDYMIVDMPPGTGDIQLTLTQRIPLAGAIVVTTPQKLAVADARRGIEMFKKMKVNVLGVFENMSAYHCPSCGHEEAIFDDHGGAKLAEEYGLPLIGSMPVMREIGRAVDDGRPTVIANPASMASERYIAAARQMAANLSQQEKEYRHKFSNIAVTQS